MVNTSNVIDFRNMYRITKNTKLIDFQNRLLLCKIPIKNDLYIWKIMEAPMCSHKCNEIESIFHVLLECKYNKRFWKYAQKIIGKPLTLTKVN